MRGKPTEAMENVKFDSEKTKTLDNELQILIIN